MTNPLSFPPVLTRLASTGTARTTAAKTLPSAAEQPKQLSIAQRSAIPTLFSRHTIVESRLMTKVVPTTPIARISMQMNGQALKARLETWIAI
jgi:hypothetical protein